MKRVVVLNCYLAAILLTEVSCTDTTNADTFDGQVLLTDHGVMFKPRHPQGPQLIKICSSSGQLKPLMDFEMGDRVDVRFEGVNVSTKGRLDECGIDVKRFIKAHRNDKLQARSAFHLSRCKADSPFPTTCQSLLKRATGSIGFS